MRMLIRGVLTMTLAASVCVGEDASFKPSKSVPYKTVKDAEGKPSELVIHIFTPPDHKPDDRRPAIVFFSGGGWSGNSPDQFYPHCAHLASLGMVAMSAQYRVRSTHNTSPRECVMDAKSAIRWIRKHATELGIDPDRLAAGGGSAGGQMAAAAGTTKGFEEGEDLDISSHPNALVLFNPVFDNGPGGYGHGSMQVYWEAISPLHNIGPDAPPTIVFFGVKDDLVPVETARKYKTRMEEQGRRCELFLYEDAGHGFFNYRSDPSKRKHYDATVAQMDRFLASLGYLAVEPAAGGTPGAGGRGE